MAGWRTPWAKMSWQEGWPGGASMPSVAAQETSARQKRRRAKDLSVMGRIQKGERAGGNGEVGVLASLASRFTAGGKLAMGVA